MSFFSFFSSSTPVNGTNSANSGTVPQTSSTVDNSVSTFVLKVNKQKHKIPTAVTSNKDFNISTTTADERSFIKFKYIFAGITTLIVGGSMILSQYFSPLSTDEYAKYWLSRFDEHSDEYLDAMVDEALSKLSS